MELVKAKYKNKSYWFRCNGCWKTVSLVVEIEVYDETCTICLKKAIELTEAANGPNRTAKEG